MDTDRTRLRRCARGAGSSRRTVVIGTAPMAYAVVLTAVCSWAESAEQPLPGAEWIGGPIMAAGAPPVRSWAANSAV